MSRRAASRNETRNRIVEATAKLHGERGVLGTTWQDIAREADVSVSTVYAHFPSLDELLPACGQLVMSRVRPPTAGDADEIIGDAHGTRERLLRVARALFSFYERGGPHIEVDIRERQLPGMREWEESQRATVAALVRAALVDEAPTAASRAADQRVLRSPDLQGPANPRGEHKASRRNGGRGGAGTAAAVLSRTIRRRVMSRMFAPENEGVLAPLSVPAQGGEARWWGEGLAVIKATGADTGGRIAIIEVTEPPGAVAPKHVHHKEDEGFWVLEGEVTFDVGGTTIVASAGDYAFGPRDIPHSYRVGPDGCRMLFIVTPAGFEELVRLISVPAESRSLPPGPQEPADIADFPALVASYGCELLDG